MKYLIPLFIMMTLLALKARAGLTQELHISNPIYKITIQDYNFGRLGGHEIHVMIDGQRVMRIKNVPDNLVDFTIKKVESVMTEIVDDYEVSLDQC